MSKLKFDQSKTNPCVKEQELTYKCFDQHNYDKEKCQLHMQNYKNCKSFWVSNIMKCKCLLNLKRFKKKT